MIRFVLLAPFVAACATATSLAPANDVVVTPQGQTVELRVGQTLAVRRPADVPDWQVDFADDVLKALQTAEQTRSPGPDGWRFEAVKAGETDVVFTGKRRADPSRPSGPPNMPSFRLTVRVRP